MIGKEITKGGVMGRVHVFKAHLCTSHLTIAVRPSPLLPREEEVPTVSYTLHTTPYTLHPTLSAGCRV